MIVQVQRWCRGAGKDAGAGGTGGAEVQRRCRGAGMQRYSGADDDDDVHKPVVQRCRERW